ncbi:MAG: S-layer domain protein [Paenibacillus sp.]|jgi:hypothetical protein|nr:S-layer domain protein [Paenibacillus sp.]
MRKSLLLFAASVMLLFTLSQSVWAFSDISSEPNAKQITALKEAGVVSGEADGIFNPRGKLTYAAGISMLVKGLNLSLAKFLFIKAPEASDYYTKIPNDAWYSDAFVIAQVNGLELPKDIDPNQIMTREQFAYHMFQAVEANGEHAYIMMYIMIHDEADVTPAYMGNIQKLLLTKIGTLDKDNNFHPKQEITRGEAAGWLQGAIEFVKQAPPAELPNPTPYPLTDLKLSSKAVNDQVNEITLSAQAPHPGYGIRITSIEFDGERAIVHTASVMPDPDRMYPQVITEVKVVTYISSVYTPVLAAQS